MILSALVLFLLALLGLGWLARWTHVARALPRIEAHTPFHGQGPLPRVSTILPVRNEEANIRECLESFLAQEYPNLEVIVVDDRSDDRTPEILAQIAAEHAASGNEIALKILQGKPCPPDWMGKNHALDQGVHASDGAFLLFVDADTRAHPALVRQTVGYCGESGTGLLTLIHSCEFQCFWDSVINTLILYLAPFQDIERFNDPEDPRGNANGPFMLFRRDVYEGIGGHRAIKGEVVEDLVIARNVKKGGHRLTWAVAPDLFTSRPYASLADLRRGWGKVLFRCMEQDPRLLKHNLVLPLLLVALLLAPWVLAGLASWPGLLGWPGPVRLTILTLALAQIVTIVAGHRFVQILFRLRPVYPWAYPLGAIMLAAVQWEACYRFLTGRKVSWKGRQYREEKA